jgi:molybdopterin-guanine dinucleotide biosynthesis protein A
VRTGIVLAGGRSSRFGGDKLAADLDGTSLLEATIAAVAAATDGIIVAGPGLPAGLRTGEMPVALIRDVEPFGGPLAALSNALREAAPDPEHVAIVVGGDMPRLVPAVLRAMLDRIADDAAIDAVLLGQERSRTGSQSEQPPRRAVLPVAVRVDAAVRAARAALESGDRALQSLVDRLAHVELPASTWLRLDPAAETLLDVDTTGDLDRLRTHKPAETPSGA